MLAKHIAERNERTFRKHNLIVFINRYTDCMCISVVVTFNYQQQLPLDPKFIGLMTVHTHFENEPLDPYNNIHNKYYKKRVV